MSIKVLPEELISQIAAGEVVERPASVVKELVENSLDAGAKHITIEIEKAGKNFIRVTDDGCGMSEEEIKLALLRHSTSKIGSLDDLFNLSSLGFRGEALPSIASISKMEITRNKSGAGLTVVVRDLFYNTPARLKFLKSDPTEAGQIADLVLRLALSRPEVAFKYFSDGKKVVESSGNGKLKDAILAVYGLDITRDLLEVSQNGVSGFISKPSLSRVDRNYESLFINGRLVKNYLLSRALEDAYQSLIPKGRYPIAILTIDVPPKEVDVNVHPSKREVKFLKTQQVMGSVYQAVKETLSFILENRSPVAADEARIEVRSPATLPGFDTGFVTELPVPNFIVSEVQPLLPVYQYLDTFIIATDGVDLVIIDQHAAHERVLFDHLRSKEGTAVSQDLLISENVEFTPDKSALLKENLEYFKGLGFEIEEFGANTFIIRAVPAVLNCSPRDVLQDILDTPDMRSDNSAVLKLIACHAAVKAGDKLSREEMDRLIRDLYKTQNPLTCPHGRPTMIKFKEGDLYKMFGR